MRFLLSICLGIGLAQPLWAQYDDEPTWPRITELSWMDRNHLAQQRQTIDDIASAEFGRPVRGNISDLELLQRIVNRELIPKDETKKLQALGAVLGDVYIDEYDLVWRSYEDEKGYSRAVCVADSSNCLFPITMLSRRIAVGIKPNVEDVYEKGVELIEPYLPKRPFDGRSRTAE